MLFYYLLYMRWSSSIFSLSQHAEILQRLVLEGSLLIHCAKHTVGPFKLVSRVLAFYSLLSIF